MSACKTISTKTILRKTGFALLGILVVLCLCDFRSAGAADNKYQGMDVLLSSVLTPMQYPLPKNVKPDQYNRMVMTKAATDPEPVMDEVRFVMAWNFCQHLMPTYPAPPLGNNRTITLDDIVKISQSRNNRAMLGVAVDECFAALAYRTSCPPGAEVAFKGQGNAPACSDVQKKMCQRLKNDPKDGTLAGLGIKQIGDPDADYVLKNCDAGVSISPAMFDYIVAHRCDSPEYVLTLSSALNNETAFQHAVLFDCPAAKDAFEVKLGNEKLRLMTAIQTLLQLRSVGSPVDPSARPVSSP